MLRIFCLNLKWDAMSPGVSSTVTHGDPMGTHGGPWGPMRTPWGPTGGPWGPRGTHGERKIVFYRCMAQTTTTTRISTQIQSSTTLLASTLTLLASTSICQRLDAGSQKAFKAPLHQNRSCQTQHLSETGCCKEACWRLRQLQLSQHGQAMALQKSR